MSLPCPGDLKLYLLDKQVCLLEIARCTVVYSLVHLVINYHSNLRKYLDNILNSDGWPTDDLKYKWKDLDPVQIVTWLHLQLVQLL